MSGRAIVVAVSVIMAATIAVYNYYKDYRQREEPHSYGARSNQRNRICVVCDESLNSDENNTTLNPCGHTFHEICLQSYVIARVQERRDPNVCPLLACRSSFNL